MNLPERITGNLPSHFVLGHIPGSKSKHYDGPEVYWEVVARHAGVEYRFERLERLASGLLANVLRVYETDKFPPAMVRHLFNSGQIVRAPERGLVR